MKINLKIIHVDKLSPTRRILITSLHCRLILGILGNILKILQFLGFCVQKNQPLYLHLSICIDKFLIQNFKKLIIFHRNNSYLYIFLINLNISQFHHAKYSDALSELVHFYKDDFKTFNSKKTTAVVCDMTIPMQNARLFGEKYDHLTSGDT